MHYIQPRYWNVNLHELSAPEWKWNHLPNGIKYGHVWFDSPDWCHQDRQLLESRHKSVELSCRESKNVGEKLVHFLDGFDQRQHFRSIYRWRRRKCIKNYANTEIWKLPKASCPSEFFFVFGSGSCYLQILNGFRTADPLKRRLLNG